MNVTDMKTYFEELLNNYNQTWYDKNLEKLKTFYDTKNNNLIYFDNHKKNDTYSTEDHLNLIASLFKNGKKTECGNIEKLIIENFNVFTTNDSACLCFIAKYNSFPKPAVRTTMYAEKVNNQWIFKHIHCSFEPKY